MKYGNLISLNKVLYTGISDTMNVAFIGCLN